MRRNDVRIALRTALEALLRGGGAGGAGQVVSAITTANGQTVELDVSLPPGHQQVGVVSMSGKVIVAGATSHVGDQLQSYALVFMHQTPGGVIQNAFSGVVADSETDGSQAGNTFLAGTGTNKATFIATQGGAANVGASIQWVITYTPVNVN